ncbi:uncharacterized protein LOC105938053 isoform X2 [Fundulus heteroclitus]|uniref:uncharacterized protein LOC105938053 isoform X2 n=1 Tax=Fundulus heteroclitus TaxID=8078 RepID=UPI00165CC452|nr:uncharacterized protein LOC105938053 isoform X2 [Fundulus heteroclitus]
MHLKLKAYCFGVPLFYTILTISLSSLGWCDPTAHSPQPTSHSAPSNVRSSVIATATVPADPFTSAHRRRSRFSGAWPGNLGKGDLTTTKFFGTGSEQVMGPRVASSSGVTPRYKRSQSERERPSTSLKPPGENCSRGTIRLVVPGKFYVTGQLEAKHRHGGYLSDSAATDQTLESQASSVGQHDGSSEESWQKLEPLVECGDDAMTLTVRRKRAIQLLMHQVNGSSMPLVQLPQQCGYSVQGSLKYLILMARYDACHVIQEDDGYVLPLLWRGTAVKVSCPVSQLNPPDEGPSALCCSPNGMTVKLRGLTAMTNPHINVREEWTPLELLAEQCGYTWDRQGAETVITIPFVTCGTMDGQKMLLFKMGKEIFMLACPNPAVEVLPATHDLLADGPPDFTRKQTKPKLQSPGPLLFIPPFYLAPPYYPHPTHHYSNSQNKEQDSYNPPTPHSLAPQADLRSQLNTKDHYYQHLFLKDAYELFMTQKPLSSEDQLDSSGSINQKPNQVTPPLDLPKSRITPTDQPVQIKAPHFQHPSHDFSSYYHYYHHPKIPLPGTPQSPGPSVPGSQTSPDSHNHRLPSILPDIQPSGLKEGTNQISLPATTQTGYKVTSVHSPHLPQLFPYHAYYYPHVTMDKAKRRGLFHLDWAAKPASSSPPPFSTVPSNHEKQSFNPHKNAPDGKADVLPSLKSKLQDEDGDKGSASVTPAVQSPAPQRPDPVIVPPDKPVFPTPGFMYNADPYKYYYHPYFNYYLKYYAPEALRGVHSHLGQTSSQSSSVQPSHFKYQTSSPPSEPAYGIYNGLMFPYYYYLPQLFRYYHELNRQGSKDSDKDPTSLLSSNMDYSDSQRSPRASEGHQSKAPQSLSNTFNRARANYIAWQRSGHGAKEKLDAYTREAPPAPSSEDRKVSCMLQKLSTDPDLYIVPLDDCPVNKRIPGQNMVHQLELQGILSARDGGHFPVRLMVGCSFPSNSPGEVRFHKTDQSHLLSTEPKPSVPTVAMRIATDASFARFYPTAHLPISLMQGKPVHVELRLLEPTESTLVLLVHSCLAYTLTPDVNWMLVYDRCNSQSVSQQLPSPDPLHIWRLKVSSFPSLPPARHTSMAHGVPTVPEDPEVYFLCHTELCSTVYGECGVSCNKDPNTDVKQ